MIEKQGMEGTRGAAKSANTGPETTEHSPKARTLCAACWEPIENAEWFRVSLPIAYPVIEAYHRHCFKSALGEK